MKVLKQLLFTETCISGLSPESSVIKEITWQVFWLVPCLLPSRPGSTGTVAQCKQFQVYHLKNSQLRG